MTCHLSSGGPNQHMEDVHHPIMTANTKIVRRFNDPVRLDITKTLFIEADAPAINLQADGFEGTLKLPK